MKKSYVTVILFYTIVVVITYAYCIYSMNAKVIQSSNEITSSANNS